MINQSSNRVLIIEDDHDLALLVTEHLQTEGYEVLATHNGKTGLETFRAGAWSIVLLDWMLPGLSGIEVLRKIRDQDPLTPVLMLTARGEETDRVLGLELGCDDYMVKPFSLRELTARIKVIQRRFSMAKQIAEGSDETILEFGELMIDPAKRRVSLGRETLQLTVKEYDLLYTLAAKPGRTFSRSQLLDLVWQQDSDVYEHTVNSHVNRLRGKIEKNPNRPRYVLTVWGVGYRFTDDF